MDGPSPSMPGRFPIGSGSIYATGTKPDKPLLDDSIALLKPFSAIDLERAITIASRSCPH